MLTNSCRGLLVSCCLLGAARTAAAADKALPGAADVKALADTIDRHLAAKWKEKKVVPAEPADDATFLRRAYLDLAGHIPSISTARDFLDDRRPDKRARLVERLLRTEDHARHFAARWGRLLRGGGGAQLPSPSLDAWLRKQVFDNTPYDRLVRTLVGAPRSDPAAGAFFAVQGLKAENLAAATSRLFLGFKLECAQCHDHPFAKWSRKQFWEFAAFFSGVAPQQDAGPGTITIPGTGRTVKARFPDGKEPRVGDGDDPRAALADWLTARDNPFFARAAVNHLWSYFLGTGLIEPVDEPNDDNPPSHPELLDELAKQLAAHDFDERFLIRAILASKAYQLSSIATSPGQEDRRLFARMAVRGLTAAQLFDSLLEATGRRVEDERFDLGNRGPRADFLARFPDPDHPADAQTSILQALYLMNGKLVADATGLTGNLSLRVLVEAERMTTARRVEELYLVTLSRRPRPAESARLVKYVEGGGPRRDRGKALADVLWALLNSSEFYLNH